jgi:hypothetical protein
MNIAPSTLSMMAQEACLERHQGLRAEIRDALENGTQYPWELFARLRAGTTPIRYVRRMHNIRLGRPRSR